MNESFNERLRRMRVAQGLSASEVARRIEVAQSTYSDWENGKGLRLPPFQSLAGVLSISVTELVVGQAPKLSELLTELEDIEASLRQIRTKLSSVS